MDAEYLSYVKSIATFPPTFYGYIISVLASVICIACIFSSFYDFLFDSFCNFLEIYTYPRIDEWLNIWFTLKQITYMVSLLPNTYVPT